MKRSHSQSAHSQFAPLDGELELLAFRYLSGELDRDAEADFELRLEHDQDAREALAACVVLSEAVVTVCSEDAASLPTIGRQASSGQASNSRATGMPTVIWMSMALTLAIAVATGIFLASGPGDSPISETQATNITKLGEQWAETRSSWDESNWDESNWEEPLDSIADSNLDEPGLALVSPEAFDQDGSRDEAVADANDDQVANMPAPWMIAAVSTQDDESEEEWD